MVTCIAVGYGDDGTREFHMGFTPWPYAPTLAAVEETYDKLHEHSDMIAFHLDEGVPWPEAYAAEPYDPDWENALNYMVSEIQPDQAVYVGLAPLSTWRDGMAPYRGSSDNMPLPEPWSGYAFNDEPVIDAYTNFCLDLIARFQPDYFNYGIEYSDLYFKSPEKWDGFFEFLVQVYSRLKTAHPDLMIGLSPIIPRPDSMDAVLTDGIIEASIPYTDFFGASLYPYAFWAMPDDADPADLASDWFHQLKTMARGKPLAVAEAGWTAEPLVIDSYGLNVHSTPEFQAAYVDKLLQEAASTDCLFVIWWALIDFDDMWAVMTDPNMRDLAAIWRDIGLFDGTVTPRIGLQHWDSWLNKTYTGDLNIMVSTTRQDYTAGQEFILSLARRNVGDSFVADEYLFMDVYGQYFFWPSWRTEVDFQAAVTIPHGLMSENILSFTWPDGVGGADGLRFWAGWVDQGALVDYDYTDFGYR